VIHSSLQTERLAEKRQAVPEPANAEPKLVTQENNADDHDGNPPEHGHDDSQSTPIKETGTEEEDSSGDHGDGDTTAAEYDSHEEPEEAWEEEVSAVPLPKLRRRHRVVSEDEDEDEGEGFEKPPEALLKLKVEKPIQDHASDTEKQPSRIKSPTPPPASPPKPPQPLSTRSDL
jgi:hypothetical protein